MGLATPLVWKVGAALPRPVLLYDGECRFCRFTARAVARLDRGEELALLPLQDDSARALLAGLPESERLATWRLARRDGSLTGYGAGISELLEAMRATRLTGRLLRRLPGGLLDSIYGAVATRRGTLGRIVRDGHAPKRFP